MENEMKNSFRKGYNKGIGFGVLLIASGLVFLGLKTGFISSALEPVIVSWPMLLILLGTINLFKRHCISGTVLLIVGGFFLMPRIIAAYPQSFEGISGDFASVYWPVLFIIAGIILLFNRIFFPNASCCSGKAKNCNTHYAGRYAQKYSNDRSQVQSGFSKNAVFGGGDHIVLDPEFKGGEMNAVFGGITLDLRRTALPEGETYLEVNAVFGGITIFAPSDWNIVSHLDSVFGGFQDNRLPSENADKTRKLIITGACVFGGGEIRN